MSSTNRTRSETMAFPITPEMVKDAYDKTGLKPTQGIWYTDSDPQNACACGLDALIAAMFGIEQARGIQAVNDMEGGDPQVVVSLRLGISLDQTYGFSRGFDGDDPDLDDAEAYAAGRRAAQLVGLIPNDPEPTP